MGATIKLGQNGAVIASTDMGLRVKRLNVNISATNGWKPSHKSEQMHESDSKRDKSSC